ncbi:hypothetical protein [Nocardioides mangrovi]|uniref:Lipoprotein n=1 Tax=Nocardioides mangrovi TaxID=2874580 RepID=A0ABS7U8H2_9ACTN|nr:hypothetical protein [Nocardioides mangrovi]MBZ5737132.1 hypothetical protein [Nocardioides mangrovi]
MVRRIALLLAVVAGATCALLLSTGVTTTYDGRDVSCSTVVGASELADAPAPVCRDALVDRTLLAGLAGLVAVVAGSGVVFAGRPQPEYVTSERHSLSS